MISIDLSIRVFRFEGITLNDQEGIVVVLRYLGSLPCEFVHIYMSIPLRYDHGLSTIDHK